MADPQASFNATSGKSSKDLKKELVPEQRDREKGLWNFLVWSLFLSQVLTADGVLASGAHAATDDPAADHGNSGHDATGGTSVLPGSPSLMGLLGAGDGEPGGSAQNTGLASSVAAQTLLSQAPGHDAAQLAAIDANQLLHEADAGPANATSAAPAETAQSAPDGGGSHTGDAGQPESLIGDLGHGASEVVGDVVQGAVGTLTDTLGGVGDTVQTIVTDTVAPVLSEVGGLAQSLGDTLGNTVQSLATDTVAPILADAGGLVQSLGDGLGHLADIGLVLDPGQVLGDLGNGLTQTADLITQLPLTAPLADAGQIVQSLATDIAGPLVSDIAGLAQPLGDTLGNLADIGISLDVGSTLDALGHGVSELLSDSTSRAQPSLVPTLAGLLDTAEPALTAPVGDILAPITSVVADLADPAGNPAAPAQITAVLDSVDGLGQSATQSVLANLGQVTGDLLGAAHGDVDSGSTMTIATLLNDVGDAIEPVVASVNPADTASLVGDSLADGMDGILGSGGSLALNPPVLGNATIDDLFNTGGYTNYNLSLQVALPETTNLLPGAGAVAADSASLLDHLLGDIDHADAVVGGHESSHTQIVGLPSAIEDLLTRGHGDLL
jgi:hypothetical protein